MGGILIYKYADNLILEWMTVDDSGFINIENFLVGAPVISHEERPENGN